MGSEVHVCTDVTFALSLKLLLKVSEKGMGFKQGAEPYC